MLIGNDTIKISEDEAYLCFEAAWNLTKKGGNPRNNAGHYNYAIGWFKSMAEFAESIASEWAVAKYLEAPFDPFAMKKKIQADVGEIFEVKWTHWQDGQLIIHEYDRNSDIAILVTGQYPYYKLAGWIPVAVAKRDRYRHHNQPNWWISQNNLMPIDTLVSSDYGKDIARLS